MGSHDDKPRTSYVPLTENEIEGLRIALANWTSRSDAEVQDMYDRLCDMALASLATPVPAAPLTGDTARTDALVLSINEKRSAVLVDESELVGFLNDLAAHARDMERLYRQWMKVANERAVEVADLKGCARSAGMRRADEITELLREARSELRLVTATPKAMDHIPLTGPAIERLIPRIDAALKACAGSASKRGTDA